MFSDLFNAYDTNGDNLIDSTEVAEFVEIHLTESLIFNSSPTHANE